MTEELSKGTTSVTPVTGRAKPTMIQVGRHKIIASGRWNNDVMADHILDNSNRWISVGELARVGCGANTIPNKKRVRRHLSMLFLTLLDRSVFLAIEYGDDNGSASAVKVADKESEQDRQCVEDKLNRMRRSKEVSEERYFKSLCLLKTMTA